MYYRTGRFAQLFSTRDVARKGRAMTSRSHAALHPYHRGSDLLALGFGTTVAMWTIGYVCRFPGVDAPAWLLLVLLVFCLAGGGWAAGRFAGRGALGGLQAGLLAGVLNVLVLGSLLSRPDAPNALVPSAAWWIPGWLLVSGLLGVVGAVLARPRPAEAAALPLVRHGLPTFATVAAAATFLLLIAGGIVTGSRAGLAVTDWPNSYGYNMFLYPLSRMTGGIYYEHVHRLLGSLVGLTTLVLAVHIWRTDQRRWLRGLAFGALALVIVQGLLGGLRVTGHFTLSDDPGVTRPNLWLAVVHGIAGQVFFGVMVAIAAFSTRRWREAVATAVGGARLDQRLALALLAVVLLQLTLGSLLRHTDSALHAHITGAVLVLGLGIALASRLILYRREFPELRRLGHGLLHGLVLQFLLGFAALFVRNLATPTGGPHVADVAVTTIHQAAGALILACAVLAMLWSRRLLRPAGA
jgi:cytochrome c oxidase assembly protein subunit 15